MPSSYDLLVLGGGITGLAAALKAAESGLRAVVIEKDDTTGGIWRSVMEDGFIFDLGVHGLYAANTRNEAIVEYLRELAHDDFVRSEKQTKILFKGKLLNYPLVASEFFTQYGLQGFWWAFTLFCARVKVTVCGHAWMRSFRDYIRGNFGNTLNRIYFEPYVRKVWGVDPGDLSLEAIARRVRRIRIREFVWHWCKRTFLRSHAESYEGLQPATFLYPRAGAGDVVDAMRTRAEAAGADIRVNSRVTRLRHADETYTLEVATDNGMKTLTARHIVSTLPLPDLLRLLHPEPDDAVDIVCRGLQYRGIRMLCLLLDMDKVFAAQWVYFQGPEYSFSRINEFKNLSKDFCPEGATSLAIEFNCDPGDALWEMPDAELTERTLTELSGFDGLGERIRGHVKHAFSVPIPFAYPVMRVATHRIREEAKRRVAAFPNLYSIGRQGDFDYINGDECVKMAFDTVEGIGDGRI